MSCSSQALPFVRVITQEDTISAEHQAAAEKVHLKRAVSCFLHGLKAKYS